MHPAFHNTCSPGFVLLTDESCLTSRSHERRARTALLMQSAHEMTAVDALHMYYAPTFRWFSPRRKPNLLCFGSPSFKFCALPSHSQSDDHIPMIKV
jgi:hypothetical protein